LVVIRSGEIADFLEVMQDFFKIIRSAKYRAGMSGSGTELRIGTTEGILGDGERHDGENRKDGTG